MCLALLVDKSLYLSYLSYLCTTNQVINLYKNELNDKSHVP